MALTGLHSNWQRGSYQADRDWGLKQAENPGLASGTDLSGLRPYYDGSIAIGYGLDLLVNSNAAINNYLSAAGLATLSPQDETLLIAARASTLTGSAREQYLRNVANSLSVTLPSETSASTLLGFVVSSFETQLDNRLGYTMPESKERLALVSMVYNAGAGIIGPKLTAAIANDNRSEAWYEIRYNSNGDRQHASRRYKEAALFNLYDAVFNEAGAKEVMRMWTIHGKEVENYERMYPPPSAMKTEIFAAQNYLIAIYGEGKNIDNTIVGAGLPTYSYKDGGSSDIIHGTGTNDLIFGEAGNDIIFGDLFDYGDDVLYGGEGDDWLYGEAGDDVLDGGAGSNILNGGYGNDIYKINSNDGGTNTIEDYDGSGAVMLDGLKLTGGAKDTSGTGGIGGPGRYYDGNGNVYEWDGTDGSDLIINGSIKVESFYKGKLGISLTDTPQPPDPPTPPPPPEPPNDNRPPAPLPPNNGGGSGSVGGVTDTDGSYNGSRGSFNGAKNIPVPTPESPIILDLDGDGVETTQLKAGAYFDHDGNGFSEQTGWAGQDDGMLVRDLDGNGSIDNGKELFGNETLLADGTKAANGFQALSELDDNKDGKIDANDAAWSQLKIWKDTDGDGISAGDELLAVSF